MLMQMKKKKTSKTGGGDSNPLDDDDDAILIESEVGDDEDLDINLGDNLPGIASSSVMGRMVSSSSTTDLNAPAAFPGLLGPLGGSSAGGTT